MVVIEFDLPRSVSLSALDENNVTLKDFPENGGQESNKMVPRATLICRPNSHPFQERNLSLESAMKVGRSVARVKPAVNNAIFDCKFGVDVMENSRKVTHGCIVATVKLYLPDGKEAKASPSTGIQEEEDSCELGKQDLYQLNQWIQEAVIREQVLETKLGSLQRIVSATREAAEMGWTALMEEDRLLTRIESLENQLVVSSKNFHEDKLREEIRKLYDEKNIYQDVSKESLRKVLTEKMETLKKLQETERSLSNAEDERDNMKELNDKLNEQILELAEKFEKESDELQSYKRKLQEADNQQLRHEQEMQSRQDALREAEEKEMVLLAQVESRQAEIDFTKEQLANLRLRLDSMKVAEELKKDENEIGGDVVEDKSNNVKENQTETLRQRVVQLESQLKTSLANNLNGEFVPDPIGYKSKEVDRLQELLEETRAKCRVLENSVGVLLVYDICCRKSFENVPVWMNEAKSHIEPHRAVFILVGCKLDLKDQREVSSEEAARFANFNEMPFVETSAKTGENVEEAFRIVGQEIYNRVQLGEYSIHDGWDGVKAGYRRAGRDYGLVEAEAARTTCC
ncbi:hypothetical protein OUZ56_004973 [Daphnia magna]|uniref:Uncharacterized protein n=1 Tax=Daphnia magna TaxID=35525 RepID=A0ABQ9YRG1_9CRUS|nr:hypothetical protein OUZ56_004973 [Daphnia magna]